MAHVDGGEAGGRFEVRLVRPRHDAESGALGDFAERHPRRDVATVQLPSRRLIVVVRVSEAEREHEAAHSGEEDLRKTEHGAHGKEERVCWKAFLNITYNTI